ncbi:histone H1-like [Zootermopsis nevadensis]|uniref:Histone H1-III n=1 Tax=Zootermopsis nevadensis TaxID=136037 RepID=A0A067QJT4_ZOONE|nr:histone H1-like [Zootermopsis nevadensis]KDR09288.1 Histone H1-III [Zootermopsis nevadensis]
MADTVAAPTASAPAQAVPKKSKSVGKKPRTKPVHPRTSEMVVNAIKSLKERGGSSLQAIKKYIAANYKVDSEKLAPFIKKYLKTAVASGELVQTKGKGASGSFKLSSGKPEKAPTVVTTARGRSSSTSALKEKKQQQQTTKAKPKSPKKAPVKKTPEKKKQVPAPKAKKLPSKAKKATKVPTKKPKAPRPKTTAKSKASKKAAPKRK